MPSKSWQATYLLQHNPTLTVEGAALAVGITTSSLQKYLDRQKLLALGRCPTCRRPFRPSLRKPLATTQAGKVLNFMAPDAKELHTQAQQKAIIKQTEKDRRRLVKEAVLNQDLRRQNPEIPAKRMSRFARKAYVKLRIPTVEEFSRLL